MTKLLLAVLVAWAGWYLWVGPKRLRRGAVPPDRARAAPAGRAPAEAPEIAEARRVLGVEAGASETQIRAAHRRLVSSAHPDRGGSLELTRRINAARDVLLRH